MKRFFVIILLFFSILKAVANPIPVPYVEISELQFRADGSWMLEIAVFSVGVYSIEAIWIKSNSGESKLKYFEDDGSYKLLVVESSDMATPLAFNSIQDSISVTLGTEDQGWWGWWWDSETLTYGYPNSEIRTPKTGQSIAYYGWLFSITKSPTIGLENDTTGMMGTIRGIVYDVNGLPLSTMSDRGLIFGSWGFSFYPQSDGSYSTRYYSRDNEKVTHLRYDNGSRSVGITPIGFSLQPDSVVIRNLYLTDEIFVGINEINNNTESILKIYPQPIKQQFNYEISIPIKSVETYMIFRNINGQELYRFLVTENNGVITLPDNIKAGFYILQLISNKKNYATTKLIVQ